VAAPTGTEADPLQGLPATESTPTLLVSAIGDELSLRVLDLRAGTSLDLELDREEFGPIAVDHDRIWFTAPEGALTSVSWEGTAPHVGDAVPGDVIPAGIFLLDDGGVVVPARSRASGTDAVGWIGAFDAGVDCAARSRRGTPSSCCSTT
jgi:hypothetical protein